MGAHYSHAKQDVDVQGSSMAAFFWLYKVKYTLFSQAVHVTGSDFHFV